MSEPEQQAPAPAPAAPLDSLAPPGPAAPKGILKKKKKKVSAKMALAAAAAAPAPPARQAMAQQSSDEDDFDEKFPKRKAPPPAAAPQAPAPPPAAAAAEPAPKKKKKKKKLAKFATFGDDAPPAPPARKAPPAAAPTSAWGPDAAAPAPAPRPAPAAAPKKQRPVVESDGEDEPAAPPDLFDREEDNGAAAFAESEAPALPEDGVEYDERHIARLNIQLKGVEFVDDGERWRVLKVSFDAEHAEPVCFYFDAALGDKGTSDDCEYSAVDEVQGWIDKHKRRLKAKQARQASGLTDGPPKKRRVIEKDDFSSFANEIADDEPEKPRRESAWAAPPAPVPAPPPRVRTVPKKKRDPLKVTKVGSAIPRRAPAPRPAMPRGPKMRFKSTDRARPSAMDLMRASNPGAPPIPMRAPPMRPVQRAPEPPPGWRQRGQPADDRPWLAAGARGPSMQQFPPRGPFMPPPQQFGGPPFGGAPQFGGPPPPQQFGGGGAPQFGGGGGMPPPSQQYGGPPPAQSGSWGAAAAAALSAAPPAFGGGGAPFGNSVPAYQRPPPAGLYGNAPRGGPSLGAPPPAPPPGADEKAALLAKLMDTKKPENAPAERPPPPAAWVNPLAREQASKGPGGF